MEPRLPNLPLIAIEPSGMDWKSPLSREMSGGEVSSMSRTQIVDFPVRRSGGLSAELPECLDNNSWHPGVRKGVAVAENGGSEGRVSTNKK